MTSDSGAPPPDDARRVAPRPSCDCFAALDDPSIPLPELSFHDDVTPPEVAAQVEQLVALTAERGLSEFRPRQELGEALWAQVKQLPPSIGSMSRVTRMYLYGSHLVAIPREVMLLTRLVEFVPYTSYRLHWFPYELARCPALQKSTISTRALYGNYKYRPPFPRLPEPTVASRFCSVCDAPLEPTRLMQRWVSLRVATDVVPLLVHACSDECLGRIPEPPSGSIPHPHQGGLGSRPPRSRGSYL